MSKNDSNVMDYDPQGRLPAMTPAEAEYLRQKLAKREKRRKGGVISWFTSGWGKAQDES